MKTVTARTPVRGGQPPRPMPLANRALARKPWVGRSYAHLVLPVPHLDDRLRDLLDEAVAEAGGWQVLDDEGDADAGLPVLRRRWRHPAGDCLLLVVVGWYPLVVTIGPEGSPALRKRRGQRRLVEAAQAAGGLTLPDADLDRVLTQCRLRWEQALAARQVIEEQRTWLECRFCEGCGAWSAYGVLHCRGCSRRFAPADDADRDERGRVAAEETARAEERLAELGSGEGLLPDWPAPSASAGPRADRPNRVDRPDRSDQADRRPRRGHPEHPPVPRRTSR
ncbi:hypothetical protein [Actinopolymorpha pittospori]